MGNLIHEEYGKTIDSMQAEINERDELIKELLELVDASYGVTAMLEYRERAKGIGVK